MENFDVIVVGAGHAGLEAAFAAANQNFCVALVTLHKEFVGDAPCNPSIGGPAKGVVTREIDALGGMQGQAADHCQLQMKLLNSSKGAGVWALRAQIDKIKYRSYFLNKIIKNKHITLIESEVKELIVENGVCVGVSLPSRQIFSKKTILTTGTYMRSTVHVGFDVKSEGPSGQTRSETLSTNLKNLGFQIIRLKTGTPPRVSKESIDFTKMQDEPGTKEKLSFSHFSPHFVPFSKQISCHLTYTNLETHKIIRENMKKSAMFSGKITGTGPRYCPSIEDKVFRFSDKSRHQIFIEPESALSDSMYLQGLSSSLPADVQKLVVHSIAGLENAVFLKYAYAIEYDAINPTQLWPSLETKKIKSLYFAGQINGTSGYEEAACQGLIAGINAVQSIKNKKPMILKRSEAYIGVLIDDLVTKGITDPYRLLTSRAEHRLFLRNDNADDRLTKYGYKVGLISKINMAQYLKSKKQISAIISFLKKTKPGKIKNSTKKFGNSSHNLFQLLKRPEIKLTEILSPAKIKNLSPQQIQKIEIAVKFEGYIKNQLRAIKNFNRYESFDLSKISDYSKIKNISLEARDKLNKVLPLTLGQAQRISGIGISDLAVIKYYVENFLK